LATRDLERVVVDTTVQPKLARAKAGGCRGHNHPQKFRVWISGQVRRVTAPIRREMRRRAAVEPVIDPIKAEHRMGRNYLRGRDGDRINAVLAAAGCNFGPLLRWLESLLRALIRMLLAAAAPVQNVLKNAPHPFFTGDN
jgi:IS5 family transposase